MRVMRTLQAMLEPLLSALREPPAPQASRAAAAGTVAPRVLLISYDPTLETAAGARLSLHMGWNRIDELTAGYIADLDACSGGYLRYEIVEHLQVDAFPPKADGFRYSAEEYLAVMSGRRPPHEPDLIDYHQLLDRYSILARVDSGEIDEVWVFAFPYAGLYESRMAGPGAFWCNAPALERTQRCSRRFVIMGFSYERGIGEMLENFGHRSESILSQVFKQARGPADLFARYTRYEQIAPGQAEVGSIHFAPNSERDYDWGNRRYVLSRCDDWYNFPDLQGQARQVNSAEWGNGDVRLHHRWWLDHLPRAAGETNGIANNWWSYIVDPNLV